MSKDNTLYAFVSLQIYKNTTGRKKTIWVLTLQVVLLSAVYSLLTRLQDHSKRPLVLHLLKRSSRNRDRN